MNLQPVFQPNINYHLKSNTFSNPNIRSFFIHHQDAKVYNNQPRPPWSAKLCNNLIASSRHLQKQKSWTIDHQTITFLDRHTFDKLNLTKDLIKISKILHAKRKWHQTINTTDRFVCGADTAKRNFVSLTSSCWVPAQLAQKHSRTLSYLL